MKEFQTNEIRNIALLGSSGSGKTTLIESMLFEAGAIQRRGTVEAGNTVSDYFPVEKDYGYSVFTSVFSVPWQDKKLNFIDCPGSDDFIGGTVSALYVTDCALMVINAQQGLEVGTINQFRQTRRFQKPVIFIINQLDHEKADFENSYHQLREHYGTKVVAVQFPVTTGPNFNQIVDVLKMKLYQWGPEGGKPEVLEIPDELMDKAKEYQQALIEAAAENDETLMEKFFELGTLTEDEMREGIRQGLINRDMYPVFCVSAGKDMCVRRTMEFLGNVVPTTEKVKPIVASDGTEVKPDSNAPASLYFFKSAMEPHIGQVDYFKVVSGTLTEGVDLVNQDRNESKERLTQFFTPQGGNRTKVSVLHAGDLVDSKRNIK